MFVVICRAKVQPDKVETYESTFRELRAKVLASEPGIRFYELARIPGEPLTYRLVEAYEDQAAQDEHCETDYYKAASAIIMDCLEGNTFEMEVETI